MGNFENIRAVVKRDPFFELNSTRPHPGTQVLRNVNPLISSGASKCLLSRSLCPPFSRDRSSWRLRAFASQFASVQTGGVFGAAHSSSQRLAVHSVGCSAPTTTHIDFAASSCEPLSVWEVEMYIRSFFSEKSCREYSRMHVASFLLSRFTSGSIA